MAGNHNSGRKSEDRTNWPKGKNLSEQEKDYREACIRASLDEGLVKYSDIAAATKMTESQVYVMLKHRPALHAYYRTKLRVITSKAANVIASTVMDDTNPNQYDAAKLIHKRYRTDLDEEDTGIVERDGMGLLGDGDGANIVINFTPQNKPE